MKLFKGRINRKNFLGGSVLVALIMSLLVFGLTFIENRMMGSFTLGEIMDGSYMNPQLRLLSILKVVIYGLGMLLLISIWFRRFHDFNKPGYVSIILIAVLTIMAIFLKEISFFVNFALFLFLLFCPGSKAENKYGGIDNTKDLFRLFF